MIRPVVIIGWVKLMPEPMLIVAAVMYRLCILTAATVILLLLKVAAVWNENPTALLMNVQQSYACVVYVCVQQITCAGCYTLNTNYK